MTRSRAPAAPLAAPADWLTGALLMATTGLVILTEWLDAPVFAIGSALTTLAVLARLGPQVSRGRQVFLAIGAALFLAALATREDWLEMTRAGLRTAAFIAAFFTALASLRAASAGSEAISACGRFLAAQPPGRRYLALSAGGHMFGLMLSYGAISLLGGLAEASARREPDAKIRAIRVRRMVIAVQRGFISTLPWSPLAFAMAISTTLVPGASWAQAVGPCLVSAAILFGTGWALDTLFKPRLAVRPQRMTVEGGWSSLAPLMILLTLLVVSVGGLHLATGVGTVGVVMVVAPAISVAWIAAQNAGDRPGAALAARIGRYAAADLPAYRSELVLLIMAGFIGTLGARLLSPLILGAGFDLSAAPAWQVLLMLFWIIPITGQLGMNPILSVSLLAPLLPAPEALGVAPAAVIVAITGGWALSGASSPFTASTMLVGTIGGVSAPHVGVRWNGPYALTCGALLSLWVAFMAGAF